MASVRRPPPQTALFAVLGMDLACAVPLTHISAQIPVLKVVVVEPLKVDCVGNRGEWTEAALCAMGQRDSGSAARAIVPPCQAAPQLTNPRQVL